MPDILVLLGCFARGVEATGPNQSMIGMARALAPEYSFRVLAEAVEGDELEAWQDVGGLQQLPLPGRRRRIAALSRAIRRTPHDILITNGFFDHRMTLPMLALRRARLVPRRPTLVAPRGEFSPGAFALGRQRKAAYTQILQAMGLLQGVVMQATGEEEAEHIRAQLGADQPIIVIPNIREIAPQPVSPYAPSERLRLVFASRIDWKKNLEFALHAAEQSGLPIDFDIYGPVSDDRYWAELQQAMARLPARVVARHKGVLEQVEVLPTLGGYDIMILPTLGENFGHAIADALLAGVPVLLSDQTPWRDLRRHNAGWDLPLAEPERFAQALRDYAALPTADKLAMRSAARRYGETQLRRAGGAEILRSHFRQLLEAGPVAATIGSRDKGAAPHGFERGWCRLQDSNL